MFDLKGHVAIVTGSTSGIGLALAERLSLAGVKVVLNGLGDLDQIETTRSQLEAKTGTPVRFHGANMLDPEAIRDMADYTLDQFGRIDMLVPNAGVQHVAPVEEFPGAKWDLILGVNLTSVFHCIQAVVPQMKKQGRGRIISIASAHGLRASPFKSAYVAAKHGVLGLTKVVGLELAETGITCNAICPGYVHTPLVDGQIADTAKARKMTEEDVIREVILKAQPTKKFVTYDELFGILAYLASDLGASVNATALSIDGGWTAK